MFDTIAPRYDLVNRIMTFGMDRGWRRATVGSLSLVPGSPVVDLACGTGDLCRDLVAAGYRAIGIDLSLGMLLHARTPSPLVQGDALNLPLPDASIAGVVSGFALRNFVELPPVFAELARAIRPGGRIALLDVARPEGRLIARRPLPVPRSRRPAHRRRPVEQDGVPLSAPFARLPAAGADRAGPTGSRRFRRRRAPAALGGHHPALHRHPRGLAMTSTVSAVSTVASDPAVTVPIGSAGQAAAGLVARTVALADDADIDLLAVGGLRDSLLWHREAFALAGRGVALRLVLPAGLDDPGAAAAVLAALQAIPTDDEVGRPGCGPVVLAALPFDRSAPATLTIPAWTVGRDVTGRRWLTTVTSPGARDADLNPSLELLGDLPPYTPPDSFTLVSPRPHDEWAELVAATVAAVRAGASTRSCWPARCGSPPTGISCPPTSSAG